MSKIGLLCDLRPGKNGRVLNINITGDMRRRLQDIGVVEGTVIKCVQISPLGDPTAFLIRDAVIALRREDSSKVDIEYDED